MQPSLLLPPSRLRGFTLLELMIVIAIISVLSLLSWQGYGVYVRKAENAACVKKMINFGVGLHDYVSDKGTWPQEDVLNGPNNKPPDEDVLWEWWYEEMLKYGVDHDTWFCPTEMRRREKEKKADAAEGKNDSGRKLENPSYQPAKFGFGLYAPFEHANQPWLMETIGHEDGINKLMPDGRVQKEFNFKAMRGAPPK